MTYWFALFSHSGSEIEAILRTPGRHTPIMIFTDQENSSKIKLESHWFLQRTHKEIMQFIKDTVESSHISNKFVITLHGYMGIIPPALIKLPNVKFYNVHPGDVVRYPELRGKDPQEKALKLNLPSTGVILHEVDEGIDTGQVVSGTEYTISPGTGLITLINDLRDISVDMWVRFLDKELN